jgi:riboflavin kinase / FMN adenylyltransferase
MHRWRGLDAVPAGWGRSVVTIGVFDGVHRGHQQILGHAVKQARAMGVPAVVVTFDPHPSEVVRPGSHPAVLTEAGRKADLMAALGIDAMCVIPFTLAFSHLSAETFAHDILVDALHARLVVVGENFRFGHRAAGDVALLSRLGRTFGFRVEAASLVGSEATNGGETVYSSTYIRSLIAAGDVAGAAAALGRPHRLEGVVVRGDQRGRQLGFPTANLMTGQYAAVPADGIYAARVGWGHSGPTGLEAVRMAAVSVGTNPTFSGRERTVEPYILDFDGDIYGERLVIDFVARLREQRTYTELSALIEQIDDDVAQTRAQLG